MKSRCVILAFCLMSSLGSESVSAQEAEVRAEVARTLSALTARDASRFVDFFHDDARGFFVDGSAMVNGPSLLIVQAAFVTGLRTNVLMSDVDVRVYGNTAVVGALFTGAVTLPGGVVVRTGTWRYTDTRVEEDGEWKIVQFHISQIA